MGKGIKFPEEFERIDRVKSSDKLLINDSDDGIDKYATPGQFNASLKELETHYDDAIAAKEAAEKAAKDAKDTADAVDASLSDAVEEATNDAKKFAENAAGSEANAKKSETNADVSEKEAKLAADKLQGSVDDVDALKSRQGHLGNATAGTMDVGELTKCHYPTVMLGHGVPAADNIPTNLPEDLPWDGVPVFIGQQYIDLDATSGGLYYAIGSNSVSDWKQA